MSQEQEEFYIGLQSEDTNKTSDVQDKVCFHLLYLYESKDQIVMKAI